MSFTLARYYNNSNQLYPWCNNLRNNNYALYVGHSGDSNFYCFYSYILKKYVMTKNTVSFFYLHDQTNNVQWNVLLRETPTFQGYYNRNTMYIYQNGNNYYCSQRLYTAPFTYRRCQYNTTTGDIDYVETDRDCYTTRFINFNLGEQTLFEGVGSFQGDSFTVKLKVKDDVQVWINNDSSYTNAVGIYTPYTTAAEGQRYLGNKYWTWNNKQFVLSPNKRYDQDFKSGDRYYQISNIEYIYNSIDKKHRWVIWGDDTQTWGYENNTDYPIQAMDYVYTPFGRDNLQPITLSYKGFTIGDWQSLMYTIDFARIY